MREGHGCKMHAKKQGDQARNIERSRARTESRGVGARYVTTLNVTLPAEIVARHSSRSLSVMINFDVVRQSSAEPASPALMV